jgi:hypothetical protein
VSWAAGAVIGFAGWLITARVLYARWRGRQTALGDAETVLWAMLGALIWPLLALAAVVRWQPRLKRRRRKLTEAELAEIEREVGVGEK